MERPGDYTDIAVAQFREFYNANSETLKAASEYFRLLVQSILRARVPIQHVISRVKEVDECIDKFFIKYRRDIVKKDEKYKIRDHITDLIGVRVVCLYESDISFIEKTLNENFEVIGRDDKNERAEDQFGYRGLHLDAKLDNKRKGLPENKKYADYPFEIQIRTVIQDAWSVLSHKIEYKKIIPPQLKRRINRLAAMFEEADTAFDDIRKGTEKFKTEAKRKNFKTGVLNIASFSEVVRELFPGTNLSAAGEDALLFVILERNPTITKEQFMKEIKREIESTTSCFRTAPDFPNPFLIIPRVMCRYNQEAFGYYPDFMMRFREISRNLKNR